VEEKTKRILKFLLRWLITAVLLWLVLSRINFRQMRLAIKDVRWQFLIIVWILTVIAFWIRSVIMRLILKKQGCGQVKTMKVFGASAVTSLYSLIIPGPLSTGVKWYILKQHTGKGSNVLSGMVYNQMAEIVVKVLLGLVAIGLTGLTGGWKVPVGCAIMTIVVIAVCVLLLNRWTGPKISAIVAYALRLLPKVIRRPVETILEQLKVFQTAGYWFHLLIAGVNLVVSFIGVVIYICAAKAAWINVPVLALVWQSSVIFILGRLPISVANLGIREYTLIEFLALYGVTAPVALLMSMIIFSTIILMAILGAVFQITWAIRVKPGKKSRA